MGYARLLYAILFVLFTALDSCGIRLVSDKVRALSAVLVPRLLHVYCSLFASAFYVSRTYGEWLRHYSIWMRPSLLLNVMVALTF